MCIKKTLFFHFVPAADFSQADKQCCCWCCCCCCGNTTGSDLGYAARRQSVMILFDKESIRNSVSLRSLLLSFFLRSATKLVPSVMSRVSDCTPSPHSAARYWLRALFLCPLQTRRKGFTQLNPSWVQQEALNTGLTCISSELICDFLERAASKRKLKSTYTNTLL